jgi:hypothetical protein
MAKIFDLDLDELRSWIEDRPQIIRDLCDRLPPDRLYRIKSSGKRCTIHSYSEDGTITVTVQAMYNDLPITYGVFGLRPEDLEECDIPNEGG